MVATMKPGSVIVDLAAGSGGNCELTRKDEMVVSPNGYGQADRPADVNHRHPAAPSGAC
jgi:NAD/NADP transhydrogenase alpha subunit